MRRLAWIVFFALPPSALQAQDPSLHAAEIGSFFQTGSQYADIWGFADTVYLGRFGQNAVDILDVSNPTTPTLLTTYTVTAPNTAASAQDVKVYDNLLFISLESGGSDGVEIVDVRNPAAPVQLTRVDPEPGPYEFVHNVSYENGWLYLCDSSNPSIAILDLRGYDPDQPPATITSWTYELTNVGSAFVHDVTVLNGRLWVSAWDSTQVFDVSALGQAAPFFLGQALGMNAHAVWPTDDGRFIVSTEERGGGALRLYEVLDHGNAVTLVQRDSYASPRSGPNATYSAHNPVLVGDRVYLSNYSAGLAVLQIDRHSKRLERVASFDTSTASPGGFAGCWGVYPGLGEGRVVVSDIENGLHVLDLTALDLTNPSGRPSRVAPDQPHTLELSVVELGLTIDPSSVTLHTSVDGAPFQSTTMLAAGSSRFRADLPSAPCGSRIDYYFTANSFGGEGFSKPPGAPSETYTTWVTEGLTPVLHDDFESDTGWTVVNSNVSAGAWIRVSPVETGAQPGAGVPGTGDRCYVTGQGLLGGSIGAADLDGGPTRLVSPPLDFSAGDGLIGYTRWLFNDDVDSDSLTVEISNDGGASWTTVETVQAKAGGWIEHRFRVSDYVAPAAQVVIRFSAADQPNNSITEVAIDAFRADRFSCPIPVLASATPRAGSGLNPTCFDAAPPVLGMPWAATVDSGALPGALATVVLVSSAPLSGLPTPWGEFLVAPPALGGMLWITDTEAVAEGSVSHAVPVPPTPALAGLRGYAQAVVLASTGGILCNAVDLVLGY